MPKICYQEKSFTAAHLDLIKKANGILADYQRQGFILTVRQLFYQHVTRNWIRNTHTEYKRLSGIISDARLAGLIDWNMIEDRTRNLAKLASWKDPSSILDACASSYRVDMWENQDTRVEVWIEKDALAGVIEGICEQNDVPYFACKGHNSQSEQWRAGIRFKRHIQGGQRVVVIHLGDHDPSGIHMSKDNEDRLRMFIGRDHAKFEFFRIALNFDQVEQYSPPENPVKFTDSRAESYVKLHGEHCWELDALSPTVISDLISFEIDKYKDLDQWREDEDRAQDGRGLLEKLAQEHRNG